MEHFQYNIFETMYRANLCVYSKSVFNFILPVKRRTFEAKIKYVGGKKSCLSQKSQISGISKVYARLQTCIISGLSSKRCILLYFQVKGIYQS